MKKLLKSYLVFAPMLYRLILFFAVPVLLIALQVWLSSANAIYMSVYVVLLVLLSAEIMMDRWAFGSIAAKSVRQPEYLKSSRKGMKVMKYALAADTVRRFVESLAVVVICAAVCVLFGGTFGVKEAAACLALLFSGSALTSVTLTIVRFLDVSMINMWAAWVAAMIFSGIYLIVFDHSSWMLPVSAVLALVCALLGVKVILNRLEESYYDERV